MFVLLEKVLLNGKINKVQIKSLFKEVKMKDIVIKIESDIRVIGEEPQKMEMITPAKFYEKGNTLYIAYEETELSGMEGDKTILKISEQKVVMMRYGSNPSEMIFVKGERFATDYTTPYGVFKMENETKNLSINVTSEGTGRLEIIYLLEVSGISESVNSLSVDIM